MANIRTRQYIGILAAVLSYYLLHEGAHLITALCMGVFKEVKFLGVGMQVDVAAAQMTDLQMGIFCLAGAVCTLIAAVLLTLLALNICRIESKTVKAAFYYITMVMLLLDPLYLSVLCSFFGGGDMNGIRLLLSEVIARIAFGVLFAIGLVVFIRRILPLYKAAFAN
ncbi:MAG: hypothetical protein MJ168_12845 [Clostridia bacterium]|nr:hypothetical protein [Clostridia bacterium]